MRLQQMACSGLRTGALLRLLRHLTSCSPALSSLFGSGPSSLALFYESALTHLLAAATQYHSLPTNPVIPTGRRLRFLSFSLSHFPLSRNVIYFCFFFV